MLMTASATMVCFMFDLLRAQVMTDDVVRCIREALSPLVEAEPCPAPVPLPLLRTSAMWQKFAYSAQKRGADMLRREALRHLPVLQCSGKCQCLVRRKANLESCKPFGASDMDGAMHKSCQMVDYPDRVHAGRGG